MSKCWYCNEEITTGNNPEHLGICDKCYNLMFQFGNDFVKGLTDKIADLEAKLAELKQDYDNLFNGYVEEKFEDIKKYVLDQIQD